MKFRNFVEAKDKFVGTIKKQLNVPKSLWLGMPLLLSNVKIGAKKILSPTMFYVKEFDKDTVTLCNVPDPGSYEDAGDDDIDSDPDGEINLDKNILKGHVEFVISRDDFYKLQTPEIPPGAEGTMI